MTKHLTTAWLFWVLAVVQPTAAAPPEPAITVPCVIAPHRIDGDTLDVDVTIRVRVRLLDCWCPEANTPMGQAATKSLELEVANFGGALTPALLEIPLRSNRIQDVFNLNRVLARVWVRGRSLSAIQVEKGMASSTKNGELGK